MPPRRSKKPLNSEASVKTPKESADEVPMLRYGNKNNFYYFKDQLSNYLIKTFGILGRFVQTGHYHVPPVPQRDPIPEDADYEETTILKGLWFEELKHHKKACLDLELQKPKVYAFIWGKLSQESKDKVEEADDFEEFDELQDPLRLWARVAETHMIGETRIAPIALHLAKGIYSDLKQSPTESLVAYKKRFDEALISIRIIDEEELPSELEMATKFLMSLDKFRYGQLRVSIENNVSRGIEQFPRTLLQMFEIASNYKVLTTQGSVIDATAYVTNKKSKSNSKKSSQPTSAPRSDESVDEVDEDHKTEVKQWKSSNKPPSPCKTCGGDHWNSECPNKKTKVSSTVKRDTVNMAFRRTTVDVRGVVLASRLVDTDDLGTPAETSQGSTAIHLDSQANLSIFNNHNILTNVRPADQHVHVGGINSEGDSLIVKSLGDSPEFGISVFYHPSAQANILSFADAKRHCTVTYDNDNDEFLVTTTSGDTYSFKNTDGLYICQLSDMWNRQQVLVTVAQNERLYTQREIKKAKLARDVVRSLGYPSHSNLIQMINSGSIINCPVSAKDVQRAYNIYGPEIGNLKGKTVLRPSIPYKEEHLPRMIAKEQTLHVDLMFVNLHAFLVSVGTPLGFTMVNDLGYKVGGKAKTVIRKALLSQINLYKSEGFEPKTILTDGEGAIASLTAELNGRGITVNPAGPGQHVPVIERKLREIKEHARSVYNTLPFKLPAKMLPYLIFFAVSRINLVPHRGGPHNVSPREAFTGIKVDFKRDLRCGFGEYAECTVPVTDNTMKPRTHSCLSLLPTGKQGSVKFLSFDTGKVVTRSHFKILPMPEHIIVMLNAMAEQQKHTIDALEFDDEDDDQAALIAGMQPPDMDNDELVNIDDRAVVLADDVAPPQDDIDDTIIIEQRADIPINVTVNDVLHEEPTVRDNIHENDGYNDDGGQDDTLTVPIDQNDYLDGDPLQDPPRRTRIDRSTQQPAHFDTLREFLKDPEKWRREHHAEHTDNQYYGFHISVRKALSDPKLSSYAKESIKAELSNMLKKKVFTPLVQGEEKHMQRWIPSHMFLKEKFTPDGKFDKLRARLVANGQFQDRDSMSLYDQISSPTASVPVIFMIASIAAKQNRVVKTADVPVAYLNANNSHLKITLRLDSQTAAILCELDGSFQQYLRKDGSIVVKLNRALYGCIESAKLWYDLLKDTLEKDGYIVNPMEPCVFNKIVNGNQCTVAVYVDDLMFTCKDEKTIKDTIAVLEKRFESSLSVTSGFHHNYLGMHWDFSKPGEVKVTMDGFIKELIIESSIKGTARTPAANHLFEIRDNATKLDKDQKKTFHTLVAKLLYLSKRVRPDLLLAVSFLTTRVQDPDMDDQHKLDRVIRYLNSSSNLGIILTATPATQIHAYIDASFGVHADFRSHTGMYITLGNGPIDAKSTKQKLNTKSSTESELVALSDMSSKVIWCKNFLESQGEKLPPAQIYQDNLNTIGLVERGVAASDRTRHVSIRYFWIKDRMDRGDVEVIYKPTNEMVADILTKPLQGEQFVKLRNLLLNWHC